MRDRHVPTLMPLPIDVLELALTNILDNAVQSVVRANKASPLVLLHVQIDQGVWAAQVEDEGGGIPLHILGKLGQQPMPSSAFGHGMGLFLVCGMLERLEGRLSFSNTLQGAKVQLQLPLSLLS
jgi:sensor histidine kinase regulating citrate/malate metabolism